VRYVKRDKISFTRRNNNWSYGFQCIIFTKLKTLNKLPQKFFMQSCVWVVSGKHVENRANFHLGHLAKNDFQYVDCYSIQEGCPATLCGGTLYRITIILVKKYEKRGKNSYILPLNKGWNVTEPIITNLTSARQLWQGIAAANFFQSLQTVQGSNSKSFGWLAGRQLRILTF
jgi:hypothetical protein